MKLFSKIATEKVLKIKESDFAYEVVSVSTGLTQCVDTPRTSIAIGRGVHELAKPTNPIRTDYISSDPNRIFLTRLVIGLKCGNPI